MASEPLRLEYELACSVEHAFATWTHRFGVWWPRGHSVTGDPRAVVLEPRLGGRIYEVGPDGREIDWGRVTRFEPPRALGYTWHIRRDAAEATDVLLEFTDAGDGASLLQITQTGWERLGGEGPTWREQNSRGWGGLIPAFARAVAPA